MVINIINLKNRREKRKMSKHSLKFVFSEERFNLKSICYIFVLIDLFLIPYTFIVPILWIILLFIVIEEAGMIIGFMLGIRGQGRYRAAMLELQSIARDKALTVDEREHLLVQGVHHYCLELGTIALERNRSYGLNFFKKKENSKNNPNKNSNKTEVKKRVILDETIKREIGIFLLIIWGAFGLVFLEGLVLLGLSVGWITCLTTIWYGADFLVAFIIYHFFKVKKEDIQEKII